MFGRKKTWPLLDDYHALVVRDVLFWTEGQRRSWGGAATVPSPEIMRARLDIVTSRYTELGLLDEPYNDVLFSNRVVSTEAEWDAFKGEWLAVIREVMGRLFVLCEGPLRLTLPAPPLPVPQ